MKLTLKKALKLRTQVEAYLSKFTPSTTISISVFESVNWETIVMARKEVNDQVSQFRWVSDILSRLRADIDNKNTEVGVTELQTRIAHYERVISLYRKISEGVAQPTPEALAGEMNMIQKRLEGESYGRPSSTATFSILEPKMILDAKVQLQDIRRVKEELEDERAAINSTNHVEILEEEAEVLLNLGLL